MKKYMDKLKENIHINKNLFVFLLVLVIVGITAGSLFSVLISNNDKTLVAGYLNDFLNNVKTNKLNYSNSLINTFIFTLGCGLLIWILGISVIGFFIVLFILFLKTFIIGFALGSILISFKFKGIIYSLIYIVPHHIINIFIFMLLSAYALMVSYKLISSLKAKKPIDFKIIMNRYLIILLFSSIVLIITSMYEVYIVPKLLRYIL